jgi:hypothetical protein
MAEAIAQINYASLCVGAGGFSELVVRDYIHCDSRTTPTIYNGLPLVPEFRVFYDFETREPMYTVNYWEYDYVQPNLYAATDKIIFEHERERIENAFYGRSDEVELLVARHMRNVDGLSGQWSIDIMLASDKYWLIDMAQAKNSAYFRGN